MRIIAGCARGRQLKTRKGMETRPTADRVKESLFNILANRVSGALFLDIFGGNGGVGIEALSRGAEKAVFIEKNSQCVKIIKDNLVLCGLSEKAQIRQGDASSVIMSLRGTAFDIIFLDPPYHSPDLAAVMEKITIWNLLASDGLLIAEHHSRDKEWYDKQCWQLYREKKYGDTVLTFLIRQTDASDEKREDH